MQSTNLEVLRQQGYLISVRDINPDFTYCLPADEEAINREIEGIIGSRGDVADDIRAAMEQSSETWHDNAPADAAFAEMYHLDKREAALIKARRHIVRLPLPVVEIDFVTAGSLTNYTEGGVGHGLLIVGNPPVRRPTTFNEADVATIDAPLSRSLLGKKVGQKALVKLGRRDREIEVVGIDQLAVQDFRYS